MIDDIIQSKMRSAGFILGKDFFVNFMPFSIQIGVMLRYPLEGIPMDEETPGYYTCRLQFITRHRDVLEGRNLAAMVQRTLTIRGEESFPANRERGATRLKRFYPVTTPIQFPSLEGDGIEFSQHFNAAFSIGDL